MKLKPWLVGLSALTVFACGQVPGGGGRTPIVSPPVSALVLWQGFPADKNPRPIVWLGNSSPNGFSSDGGKIAAMCSKFVLGSALPKNLASQAIASWVDGTKVVAKSISAAQAMTLMAKPAPGMAASDCASVNPLVISSAHLGSFEFDTDRGKAKMTAWLFGATGVMGEFAYPALAPTAFWKGGLTGTSAGYGATLGADGRSLTYRFWGSPDRPGPCGAAYKAVLAESTSAVAIALQVIPNAAPGAPVACDAMAQERFVEVQLASSLGGRVVVDAAGEAIAVCPGSLSKGC
jgi:hypothetical protein